MLYGTAFRLPTVFELGFHIESENFLQSQNLEPEKTRQYEVVWEGRLTPGEWRQMLSHARGSLFEVEAQLIAAGRLRFLNDETSKTLHAHVRRTGATLLGLIRFVQSKERRHPPPTS